MKHAIAMNEPHKHNSSNGFTLLETLSVLTLIAVVTTLIVTRFMDKSVELIGEIEAVKGHLRYAQTRAMNSNESWGINFATNFYTLEENNTTSTTPLPGKSSAVGTLSLGTITSTVNPVVFNQWGSPGAIDINVTISDGSASQSFTISALTGFIP